MVETSHTAGSHLGDLYPSLMRPFQDLGRRMAAFFAPTADAAATGEAYEVNMELPGVSEDDIEINVRDNMLTVHGEKKTEREEKGKTYFFSERTYGAFQRSFRLPENSDSDKISAAFKDGVLSVRIPKTGPAPETTRRIKIKGA